MRIPARIAAPVFGAILLVGVVLVVLFWQLEDARALLMQQLHMGTNTGDVMPTQRIALLPDTADETLLHMRTGDLAALRGQWADAEREYQAAADAGGGLTALHKLAQAQLQRRDIRGAQATLDAMRRAQARSEDVLLLESMILLRTGELTKAKQLLTSAEDSPQKQYGLALLAIVTGDHESAKAELALVTAGWEPVLRSYARTLAQAYEEYTLFPDSPQIHLQTLLGRALAQVQECELALPLLLNVTQQQPDYRDAWVVQGFCELSTERTTEALASLEQAYQLDPEKPEIQYFLARAYLDQDDHGNALTFLQYALRNGFSPASEVRTLIAREALQIGNATLALEQYAALTKESDATPETFSAYVSAAITADQAEEAYAAAKEAVARWPNDAAMHELLGWAAAETGRSDEARDELNKALELNPELESALEKLNAL